MKQLTLAQFDLVSVKYNGKKGLDVNFYQLGVNSDLLSISSDNGPHPDFVDKLNEFRELFAVVNETLEGWDFARDNNNKNLEAAGIAKRGYETEIEKWVMSGVKFTGSGENLGIQLTGSRKTESGSIGQASPQIKFSGELGIEQKAITLSEELKNLVWKYVFKNHRAQGDLFEEETVNEEPESGLNNNPLRAV